MYISPKTEIIHVHALLKYCTNEDIRHTRCVYKHETRTLTYRGNAVVQFCRSTWVTTAPNHQ